MASSATLRVLAFVTLILAARFATAAGPLVRADATPRPNGLPSERVLTVDHDALVALRTRTTATLDDFPLGGDGPATLELTRIRPFDEHTRFEEVTDTGVRNIPLPDETYFSGTVRGAARSRVLLIATNDGVRGFVVRDGATYPFGRDGLGTHRVYALRDVDPATHPGPSEFCGNDLHPDAMLNVPVPRSLPTPSAMVGPNTVLEVQVAVDTDNELRNKFADTNAATSYLTGLLAAANVIYERDVKVRLKFSYVRLWSTTDPWTATDTLAALNQVQAYWLDVANGMDAKAGVHDIVHFISGKSVSGGIAYLQAACDHSYGFGVSQVFGSFDVSNPNAIWDVLVVTHEIGHNLGSPHTHCYNPPVDQCYNAEPGCYAGPESVPAGGGTIMSYCHLLSGGLANVDLLFGATVSTTIRTFVTTSAPCLSVAAVCGDGTIDPGEDCDDGNTTGGDGCSAGCEIEGPCGNAQVNAGETCDDGNTTGGDGCSATCQLETVCGNGVTEGVEQCDDGNTTSGDGCSSKCRLESTCGDGTVQGTEQCDDGNTDDGDGCSSSCRFEVCGNHIVDPNEECDDGNTVSGDGCAADCTHEPVCGDGTEDDGEECDDGNTVSGDGCSATCMIEPCEILIPHQTTWFPVKMIATPGTFALHARFGVESDALDLQEIADAGLRIMVDGGSGARVMDVTIDGGDGWTVGGNRVRYRDPKGSASGVRSVVIHTHGQGVSTVDLKITSRGGAVANPNDAPPTVTVLLGDETDGEIGACGRYAFGGNECVKRGKKLTCR